MKLLSRWLLVAGFAVMIFGGKLRLIEAAGSDLPTMDAWDAESESVLRPWLEGRLTAADIFRPQNEHRLVTTKLYTLGLFVANGQWDVLVETTVNAAIHTLAAIVLLLISRRWLRGVWSVLTGGLLLLLFLPPFSWENTLNGFQVQFYFLLLFSLVHLWFSLESDRFTWRWVLGQVCGALAVVSMASGFFSSAVVFVLVVGRLLRERRWLPQQTATALICLGFTIAGWLLKNPFPGHAALHARSVGTFAWSFLQLVAWPGPAAFPWVIVPGLLFVLVRATRPRKIFSTDPLLIGLLGWSLLQCAALAYGRGGGDMVLSSRYLDLLSVNVTLGLVFAVTELSGRTRTVGAGLWLVAVGAMLIHAGDFQWRTAIVPDIPQHLRQQEHVRQYLRTLDPHQLTDHPWPEIPYRSATALLERLQTPGIQSIMPPSVRRPVPLRDGTSNDPVGVPAPLRSEGSPVALSTRSVSNATSFVWRSPTQSSRSLPILRFGIAGDLGKSDRHLHLVVKSAAGETAVSPDTAPGLRWKTVNVVRPAGAWWVEATDADPDAWFAFTEPIELGRWSWLAEKLLKHNTIFLLLGLALLAGGGALATVRRQPLSVGPVTALPPAC